MDRAFITDVYRSYGSAVRRRARQILGTDEAAEEVLHDVFLSLLNDPLQFRSQSSPLTWLYSATTHRCLNILRDAKTRQRLLEREGAGRTAMSSASPETSLEARQFLGELPDEAAQVAVYYYLDEMSHDEIAGIMGSSRRHIGHVLERVRAIAARKHP